MDKTALITGCSSGIGRALATKLREIGWEVIATARKIENLKELDGIGCRTYSLDVTDENRINKIVKQLESEFGRIDLLINNAGFGLMGPAMDIGIDDLKKQFDSNFFGHVLLTQGIATIMRDNHSGVIVNIGSISGIAPTPYAAAYCASKAAFHAWSESLRMELAPFGIKVITVQPGAITSNFGKNADRTLTNRLREESWYAGAEPFIHKRALTSQEKSTPPDEFASRLVRKITRKNPPSIIRLGKKSFFLPLLKSVLPVALMDKILARKYGLDRLRT